MLRKVILGAAAIVVLGASAMSPTAAEAKSWKKKHHFHKPHITHFYGAYGYGHGHGCYVKRWVPTPHGYRLRVINRCAYF